jgi:hypothetical protein
MGITGVTVMPPGLGGAEPSGLVAATDGYLDRSGKKVIATEDCGVKGDFSEGLAF